MRQRRESVGFDSPASSGAELRLLTAVADAAYIACDALMLLAATEAAQQPQQVAPALLSRYKNDDHGKIFNQIHNQIKLFVRARAQEIFVLLM